MTPSIETRIAAIAGALEYLVIPALAGADSIVQEQTALALGHLKIIGMQLPHVEVHHAACLAEQLRLARELGAMAAGGAAMSAAAETLARAAALAATDESRSTRDRRNDVAGAVSALVITSSIDGSRGFLDASHNLLVEHALRQSRRDRAWYGPTGLDSFAAELPAIPELVAEERAIVKQEAA